jgi:Cu2+-containing amine oxidase
MLQNPLLLSLVKYVLGSELVDYFDLIALEEIGETLHIHLDELNITPSEYASLALSPNGFFAESTIKDFPLRDKKVVLHIANSK